MSIKDEAMIPPLEPDIIVYRLMSVLHSGLNLHVLSDVIHGQQARQLALEHHRQCAAITVF